MRLYSVEGKSVNLTANGGGLGAKTGLYAIPTLIVPENTKKGYIEVECGNCFDYEMPNSKTRRGRNMPNKSNCLTTNCNFYQYFAYAIEFDADGKPIKAISSADNKTYTIYEVNDGQITIKGKTYPIKLIDGYYIIRKLTVTECCRLQTLPDDYCKAVSATQAYKGLGNGWTAEVIIHILRHANIPLDEEIIVLSMYDGIGTGRYCFDKMGYKNIKYYAYEIDEYPIKVAISNYPDIIQCGDAFKVREDDWKL
jgi:site-specific DNA-cytosine methylase